MSTVFRSHVKLFQPLGPFGLRSGSESLGRVNSCWKNSRKSSTLAESAAPSTNIQARFPLSALPTSMLLRSLFIAGISSNPILLMPSLSILSLLSKPRSGFLLSVDRNPLLHSILKRTFYRQFCAGETETEAKTCVQQLKDLGFRGVIMTYAKETVFDFKSNTQHGQGNASADNLKDAKDDVQTLESQFCPHIDIWRKGTLETIDLIGEGDILALKVSGAGPVTTAAFSAGNLPSPQMMEALDEICSKCRDRSVQVIVDAESQHFQKGIARTTLELMRKFNHGDRVVVYNTYQAYLKGTPELLASHLNAAAKDGFTVGLKLVRGAYILTDNRALIHDTKQATDDAYNGIAQGALRQHIGEFGGPGGRPFPRLNLFLASHNRASVIAANKLHQDRIRDGLPTVPVAFGQLHGMSDEVSFSLLSAKDENQESPEVYKCTTWGTMGECLAYLLRRAVENRDAVLRTKDEYNALKAELWRRLGLSRSQSRLSSN